jgi:hypothetical protein
MREETGGRSFDALAKGLASGEVSRRKALRLMGAALLGGTLASMPGVAFARPTPIRGGKGPCLEGRTNCRGQCVNLNLDENNCGQCANVCSSPEECINGTCRAPCTPDTCPNGCCDANGVCQPGTATSECGFGGEPCHVCTPPEQCRANGTCRASCGPDTCPNGCCDANGECLSGDENVACGTGGVQCVPCDTGAGLFCRGDICQAIP